MKYLCILHFLHCRTSCSVISITTVRGSFSRQTFFLFLSLSRCPAYIRLSGLAQLRTATRHLNDPRYNTHHKFPQRQATEIEKALDEHNMPIVAAHQYLSLCTCMGFQHNQQQTTLLTTRTDKTKTDKILNTHLPHNSWLINKKYYLQMKEKQNVTNWSSMQQSLV